MIDLMMTNNIFDYKTKQRFWSKVDNRQSGRCWIWNGAVISSGYGYFDTTTSTITDFYAHRVSYIMHYGAIPKGMLICHKCDNKRCVNPVHLYIGTSSDNVKDRYNRFPNSGRGRNYSKLTSDQFEDIFRLHKLGLSHTTISKEFNVVPQTISNIVRGNTKLSRRV